jgi:hypothetical protein
MSRRSTDVVLFACVICLLHKCAIGIKSIDTVDLGFLSGLHVYMHMYMKLIQVIPMWPMTALTLITPMLSVHVWQEYRYTCDHIAERSR